jgi:hypothetical protein
MTLKRFGFGLLMLLGILFVQCSSDDDSEQVIQDYIESQDLAFDRTASGLYVALERSTGSTLINESEFIRFELRLTDLNETVGLNTFDTDDLITTEVLAFPPGIVEAFQLMGPGDLGTFILPPSLSGGGLQEGEALVYQIEIIDVFDNLAAYNEELITDYLAENNITTAQRMDNGLYIKIDEPGNDVRPDVSSTIVIDYQGYLLNDDVFDSSFERGVPNTFALAALIEGWQIGLQSFGEGGQGMLFIPSNLGFGRNGTGNIPPNAPIAFDIQLISVEQP